MSYKRYGNIMLPVKGFFKRQDHPHMIHEPLDFLYPALAPCPYLWTDIVKYRYTLALCYGGGVEIEIRKIDDDQQIRSQVL